MKLIRAAAAPTLAWKNGGGTTRELLAHPEGAGMDEFLWRISLAEIGASGAFSVFPGILRVFTVVAGTVRLTGPGFDHLLDAAASPFGFDGGLAVSGAPVGGPVLALNVMARQGHFEPEVLRVAQGTRLEAGAGRFFLALEPQELAGETLEMHDSLSLDSPLDAAGAGLSIIFVPA